MRQTMANLSEEQGFGLAARDVPLEIPDGVQKGAGLEVRAHRPARGARHDWLWNSLETRFGGP